MSIQVGTFHFNKSNYNSYTLHFLDISGLNKKGDVKIAGVKVGWVDKIELQSEKNQVCLTIMIPKNYILHVDAYGIIRQDGLLGNKYIEIVPGSPLSTILQSHGTLSKAPCESASIDELLFQFKQIATNMQEVTNTFKNALGGPQGDLYLKEIFCKFEETTTHIGALAHLIDKIIINNEQQINLLLIDLKETIHKVNQVAETFEQTLLPMQTIAIKINGRKGLMGKLVNGFW